MSCVVLVLSHVARTRAVQRSLDLRLCAAVESVSCKKNFSLFTFSLFTSLVPRPHPSAREKGLVKNDTILGPLRHSGYVTTMLIANQLAGLWFTYDHILDMADQLPCVFSRKNTVPKDRVLFGQ